MADKVWTLVDNFSAKDTDKWVWYGDADVADGRLLLPIAPASNIFTVDEFDLDESLVRVELLEIPTGYFQVGLQLGDQGITVRNYQGSIGTIIGSWANVNQHAVYDPVAHRWLQMRATGGIVYLETSPDGVNWNVADSFSASVSGRLGLSAQTVGTGGTGQAVFANLNAARAAGAGQVQWSAVATGHTDPVGTASGTLSLGGAAFGAFPAPSAEAAGAVTYHARSVTSGLPPSVATASGALHYTAHSPVGLAIPGAMASVAIEYATASAVGTYVARQTPGVTGWWPEVDGLP